ncbi:MAG: YggS family pyridoxal phosphate-dependent enzyme [Spirochaetia bacterium]|jgi:pyridoxal phosphate enzyme (YggS family)|nr:YggS family pyridoxal phosphate-dependent enzyme [Spirochaetia bacterium]
MKEALNEIHRQIEECGREGKTRLMAVSKTHPWEAVMEAYDLGQRLFGENRVQEVLMKFPPKGARPEGMELHLIGHLQSNKVKKAVSYVDAIDSVDSMKVARLINSSAADFGIIMPVLLEYNTSGEKNKSGFGSYAEILELCQHAGDFPHIRIDGLMTIGPLGDDHAKTKQAFEHLVEIQSRLASDVPSLNLHELSMGMSGDYLLALQCGSTLIRVGTKIFGKRDYGNKDA